MRFYDLKVTNCIVLWKNCPFTGTELNFTNFRTGLFSLDHIYSTTRTSKKKEYRKENDIFLESIINIRPLVNWKNINLSSDIDYKDKLKYNQSEFEIMNEVIRDDKYKMLWGNKSITLRNKQEIYKLVDMYFIECDIEAPDWFFTRNENIIKKYNSEKKLK